MNTLKTPEQVAEQTATEYHLFLEDSSSSSNDAAYLVERIATAIRAE